MSKRAEDLALKVYPIEGGKWQSPFGMFEFDPNAGHREGFIRGYEQAEKDLGWHPATEYPPEDEEVIVLTVPHGIKSFYEIQVSHMLKGTKLWAIRDKVVWWMPMPKLPKEEERR